MNTLAVRLTRQLVTSQKLVRHLSSLPQANKQQKSSGGQEPKSEWMKKLFVIASGVGTGYVMYSLIKTVPAPDIPKVDAAARVEVPSRRSQFNFIADVVESAAKSLVFIEIQDTRRMDYHSGKPMTVSNGSGFIVDSNGLILTNAHVVINKPRTNVSVRLSDGRSFMGIVEAVDPVSDLATVRIHCKNLPALKLGKSSELRSGEFVVALGSPLSLSNTVTSGVVSSTQRPSKELGITGHDINYIQTDAAITFGNSGGPLVNLDGEAIGINSMKVTPGISFAIPIDYAKKFLTLAEEKVKQGKAAGVKSPSSRRYMGITMLTLTSHIIAELKQRGSDIPESLQNGILVWKVIVNSPAHSSGLLAGDIIVEINGKSVTQSSDIYEILASDVKVVKMTLLRGGQIVKLNVIPENPE